MKKPLRLLVVEDSEDDTLLLLRVLRKGGFDPEHRRVETPQAMAGALASQDWDLVISDYMMPSFNAVEALSVLQSSGRDLPLLVVSGSIGETRAVEIMQMGARDYIFKDNLTRLVPAVVRELREAEARARGKEAEARLKTNEATFRLLFQSHPQPMWVYDRESLAFLEVNDAAVAKYGYGREEFLRMSLRDIRPPEDLPRLEEDVRRERSALQVSGPWVHLLKDGRRIEVEIHSHTLTFQGRPAALVVAEDVTDKLAAERALQASERRLRTLMEAAQEGIWAIDAESRTTFVNRAMAEMLGTTVEAMAGSSLFDFTDAEGRAEAARNVERRRQGIAESHAFTFRRVDGSPLETFLSTAPLFDEGGAFSGAVAMVMDLTDWKKMEGELARARTLETIGLIAGGVAHEVRNPLFAIQTVSAALHKKLGGAEEFAEYLQHIREQVERLNALMKDLLILGRPIDPATFGPVLLREVIEETVRNLAPRHPGAAEAVETCLPAEPACARGARDKLAQVVENLLSNALHFTPAGGSVRVSVGREGEGRVKLEVADAGPGIAPELLPRLFEPFQSRRKGGTGLGLAIVHKIVEAHGGTVEARNNDPGPGATFTVTLPLEGSGL
ncbi:MAG: PAS domain S-box protein [Acidobacteriota bacterium]